MFLVRPNTCRGGARGHWSWCRAANWARPPGGSVCRRGLLCIFRSFVVHHHHGKMLDGWAACLDCWWQCVNVMWCVAMQSGACKTYRAHKSRWCREMSFRTFLLTMIRHHYWSRILSQMMFYAQPWTMPLLTSLCSLYCNSIITPDCHFGWSWGTLAPCSLFSASI